MSSSSIQNSSACFNWLLEPKWIGTSLATFVATAIIRNPHYSPLVALACFAGATYLNTTPDQHSATPAIKMLAAMAFGLGLRHAPILYPTLFITGIMLWDPKKSPSNPEQFSAQQPESSRSSSPVYLRPPSHNPEVYPGISVSVHSTSITATAPPPQQIYLQPQSASSHTSARSFPQYSQSTRATPDPTPEAALGPSPSWQQQYSPAERAMFKKNPGKDFDPDD